MMLQLLVNNQDESIKPAKAYSKKLSDILSKIERIYNSYVHDSYVVKAKLEKWQARTGAYDVLLMLLCKWLGACAEERKVGTKNLYLVHLIGRANSY